MSQIPDSVLRKIESCLRLSASSNEHEAAAALRQAQKMMAAYNVTEGDLLGNAVGVEEVESTVWKNLPVWEVNMAVMIGKAFGCRVLCRNGARKVLAKYDYVGLKQNATLAVYTHKVFAAQVRKAREAYLRASFNGYGRAAKILHGNSFAVGFVENVEAKVQAMGVPAAANEKADELAQGRTRKQREFNADLGSMVEGYREGKKASLHRPIQ